MPGITVPQNNKELAASIKKLADARRHVAQQEAETEAAIALLKERLARQTKMRCERILVLESAIEVYCEGVLSYRNSTICTVCQTCV